MVVDNPFAVFRSECEKILAAALKKLFSEIRFTDLAMEKPPNLEFGQLASSLCFEFSKQIKEKPITVAQNLVKAIDKSEFCLVDGVASAGTGYINFLANFAKFSALNL
jgi:arginyl-tRNA synthetase